MLIFNGETVLDVTPKAYEVIYKNHGYTVQTEPEPEAPAKKPAKSKAGE